MIAQFKSLPFWARAGIVGAALWGASEIVERINEKDLTAEVVVITGAGSGIGREMAIKLAKCGCRLVLWDINEEAVRNVANEIVTMGGEAKSYKVDICNRKIVYEVANKVIQEFGQVDILINNAGIVSGKKLLECDDHLIERTFHVNTVSHFWMLKAFLPGMIERNYGHVVTIASMAGILGVPGLVDYCASKHGAIGTHESLRMELYKLGKDGVHTTCVCPSYISTGMFDGVKMNPLVPIMEPGYVADRIIQAIKRNEEKLLLPGLCRLVPKLIPFLHTKPLLMVADFVGLTSSMETFKQTRQNN